MSNTTTITQPSRPAETNLSSQILGTVFNPLVRRFLNRHGHLATVDPKEGLVGFQKAVNVDLTKLTEFENWSRYASVVRYRNLSVTLMPGLAAMTGLVTGIAAWHPNTEGFLSVYSEFQKQPNATIFDMGAVAPGGKPNQVLLPCGFTYGVQRQVKPIPLVGGPPRLSLVCSYSPLPHHTSAGWKQVACPKERTVFRIIVEFEVEWVQSL